MWPPPPGAPGAPAYPPPQIYQQGAGYPPPAYGAPPPAYGAPPPAYGAPPPAYGAPPPAFGAPAYGTPAPAYGAQYGAPQNPPPAGAYPTIGASPSHSSFSAPPTAPPPPPHFGVVPPAPSAPPAPANPQPATAPGVFGQPPPDGRTPSYSAPSAPPHGMYGAVTPVPHPMPQPGGNKKAVLIGCSYPGTQARLNGCINDVQCMAHLLKTKFGFVEQNIVILRDDRQHPDWYPTRMNIYRAIQWLMSGQQPGHSLFFHFSGHGSQQADRTGDEDDGYDETILPTDYKTAGQIVDDELNQRLVRPLLGGVILHAVVDACHSGTVLDLPYRTKLKNNVFAWKGRPNPQKCTGGGTVFQFGACRDSQVAQDTNRMSGSAYTGAATFSFIQAIERGGPHQSYAHVLGAMTRALEQQTGASSNTPDIAGMVFGFLLGGGGMASGQTPVLSSDRPQDINMRLLI